MIRKQILDEYISYNNESLTSYFENFIDMLKEENYTYADIVDHFMEIHENSIKEDEEAIIQDLVNKNNPHEDLTENEYEDNKLNEEEFDYLLDGYMKNVQQYFNYGNYNSLDEI